MNKKLHRCDACGKILVSEVKFKCSEQKETWYKLKLCTRCAIELTEKIMDYIPEEQRK